MSPVPVATDSSVFDAEAFSHDLAQNNPISHCKAAITSVTEAMHQQFRDGTPVATLIRQRATFIDTLLAILWDREDWGDAQIAVVAVGGYGRGELHPHSDIDLLFLLGDNCDSQREQLSNYLTLLWDIGLNIGHSVRSVDECVEQARADITVLTNLMEARVIRGDAQLMDNVRDLTGTEHMWASREFFRAKLDEQNERHTKFADTEYNLEPNIKSSPGGLRDLQVLGWIAERHFGVESLEEITQEQFLNSEERELLINGRDFMWQVRYALHMLTNREEDRLLFDHQRELAALWGLEDGNKKLAVEKFMQVYYRWALALGQLNDVLIQNFDQAILRETHEDKVRELNARFQVRNGYIEARDTTVFEQTPNALLEIFLLCANDDDIVGVAAPTIRLIRESRHLIDAQFRSDPTNTQTFMDILGSPVKMTRQLRRMTRYGVLDDYLPEFGRIVGQMQHDLFHVYTVDAHTLEVVKNCRRHIYPDHQEQFPVSSRIAARLRKIELLYVAALYHDIGKGRGGDHSELGAVDAELFCTNHQLDARDTELVVWLVRNHLVMSSVSQRKDLSDPEVIQQFARHVGDEEHLDYLFVLTVADINGTNPTLWNAWRGSLLRQLYNETRRALRRGLDNPLDKQALIAESQRDAARILEARGFTPDELEDIWAQRGDDYFLRERPEDIAWHSEAIANHVDKDTPLVLVRNNADSSVANTTQIFVHARSRAQLFSRVCACLGALDLSIHDARIYSGNDEMSLDTFFVLDSSGQPITEDIERQKRIKADLAAALGNDAGAIDPVSRRTPRQKKSFPIATETRMEIDEQNNVSVLEIAAADRPGLLARLGSIFVAYNIDLQAAKIQTLGERVEDVFFITDQHGNAIVDADVCELIQKTIREELDDEAAA